MSNRNLTLAIYLLLVLCGFSPLASGATLCVQPIPKFRMSLFDRSAPLWLPLPTGHQI
jgi:hypothetical protein